MTLAIAALPLGGGTLAICPMPGRDGAYGADLGDLRDFAPELVVSMTEIAEMERMGAGGLPLDLAGSGIAWLHLPVVDFGAPEEETAAAWPTAARQIHAVLARGGRVLVHCMGGCGRSGMAVLRLMVEAGETPEAALSRLRAVRPCAVETAAQFAWAAAGPAVANGP